MAEATFPLSIVFALQGIAAAIGGKWALDVRADTSVLLHTRVISDHTINTVLCSFVQQ